MTPGGERGVVNAIVKQIARQRRPEDLDAIVELLAKSGDAKYVAGQAALLKALSRLPADALAGNTPCNW